MKKRRSWLRRLLWWGLPVLVLCVVLVTSLVAWVLLAPAGTRLALSVAASQLDGEIEGVEGTLWDGVRVGRLDLALPGVSVSASNLFLQGEWRFLMERRVWVRELSADRLAVALTTTEEKEEEPSTGPLELPVTVSVDRLALGEFTLTQNGEPLPVTVNRLSASVALADGLQVRLASLDIGHDMADVSLEGEVRLQELAAPWPMAVDVRANARGTSPSSPVCLQELPGRPADAACEAQLHLQVNGSLAQLAVAVDGSGPGLTLKGNTNLDLESTFPLQDADVSLGLADGSSAQLQAALERSHDTDAVRDRVTGKLSAERLDLALLSGGAVPQGKLTTSGTFDIAMRDQTWPERAVVDLVIADDSRWNNLPLSGKVRADLDFPWSEVTKTPDWMLTRAGNVDVAVNLGADKIILNGGWGSAQADMKLDVAVARLANWWPDLPGAVKAKGTLGGTVAAHRVALDATYIMGKADAKALGEAPVQAKVRAEGGWGSGQGFQPTLTGWRGNLRELDVRHAGLALDLQQAMSIAFMPAAVAPQWQWQVGSTALRIGLPRGQALVLASQGARGGDTRWQTAGRIDALALTPALLGSIASLAGEQSAPEAAGLLRNLVLDGSWDLSFNRALTGKIAVARRSGDVVLPGDNPLPVGLERLAVNLDLVSPQGTASRAQANLELRSKLLGGLQAQAEAGLHAPSGVPGLDPDARITASLKTDKLDIAWLNMFAGDAQEINGEIAANLNASGTLDGEWDIQGAVTGEKLRFVRIDDGIRLFDGTLALRIQNDVVMLDSLRFPAVIRVMPTEWRTRTWITEQAEAQKGSLNVSGQWRLRDSAGQLRVALDHYPIVQRSDRFAMFSGDINIDAALPKVDITGKITADAGWVSVEMLSAVPTLDDDVHITTAGAPVSTSPGLQLAMDLVVDLGPRFYLTGMGIDSGLVGSLRLLMSNGQLTGEGTLRTRGGRFEAYGQRLQLARGYITFQGALDNPLLDIEAMRRGEAVEAGVRVTGTARRPKIDLVSVPNVSEVEKLSWLILGRGPDQSGNDVALLLALGSSLLSGTEEPMYKKFGLDDVAIQSGSMGSAGSLLPDVTVASQATTLGDDDLQNQFLVVSKRFSDGMTLSVEQALSGSGLVARLSYWLSRNLSADLRVGEVNGLGLVYRSIIAD